MEGAEETHYPPDESSTYRLSFLQGDLNITCLVGGCPGRETIRITLRVHFMHHNVQNTVVILEEGTHPLPHYTKCDIFVTCRALSRKH